MMHLRLRHHLISSILTFYLFTLAIGVKAQDLKIDHVIISVANLENSSRVFEDLGFKVKPGTLHSNGIINKHIKFSNDSSVELISIQGIAKDLTAEKYQLMIEKGGGGTFIALEGIPFDEFSKILDRLNIRYHWQKHRLWDYITFDSKELQHLFFIDYHHKSKENSTWLNHPNKTQAMTAIHIDQSPLLRRLLDELVITNDLKQSKENSNNSFFTQTGSLILLNNKPDPILRVRSIEFTDRSSLENLILAIQTEAALLEN